MPVALAFLQFYFFSGLTLTHLPSMSGGKRAGHHVKSIKCGVGHGHAHDEDPGASPEIEGNLSGGAGLPGHGGHTEGRGPQIGPRGASWRRSSSPRWGRFRRQAWEWRCWMEEKEEGCMPSFFLAGTTRASLSLFSDSSQSMTFSGQG